MSAPTYRGRHRRPVERIREASQLVAGDELLGRYVLEARLSPAEPISFRAEDALLSRSVTVTFLNLDSDYAELIHGSDLVPGISGLRHAALAPLLDVGHEPGVRQSFIVTDFVDGVLLSELAEEPSSRPDLPDLRSYVEEVVADLVFYLRANGLGHRDLSPHNIRIVLPPGEAENSSEKPLIRVGLIGLFADPSAASTGRASDAR